MQADTTLPQDPVPFVCVTSVGSVCRTPTAATLNITSLFGVALEQIPGRHMFASRLPYGRVLYTSTPPILMGLPKLDMG